MIDKTTCPLKEGTYPICQKEQCEWWNVNQCVVHDIADNLKNCTTAIQVAAERLHPYTGRVGPG